MSSVTLLSVYIQQQVKLNIRDETSELRFFIFLFVLSFFLMFFSCPGFKNRYKIFLHLRHAYIYIYFNDNQKNEKAADSLGNTVYLNKNNTEYIWQRKHQASKCSNCNPSDCLSMQSTQFSFRSPSLYCNRDPIQLDEVLMGIRFISS